MADDHCAGFWRCFVLLAGTKHYPDDCSAEDLWSREPARRVWRYQIDIEASQLADVGFAEALVWQIKEAGVPLNQITLEITEKDSIPLDVECIENITTLIKNGLKLSLDEFGTGFSSIMRLADLPFSQIKLDADLVARSQGLKETRIIEFVAALACALDLELVAEGIETEAQRAHLLRMGVDSAQGYLFHKPMEGAALLKVILAGKPQQRYLLQGSGFPMFFGFTVRFLCAVLVAGSLGASTLVAGNQYIELSLPVGKREGEKIEVVEVFSYACQHCYNLENTLNSWVENLPADVKFERIPAMFGGIWDIYGRLFLTLQVMKADPSVHKAVFEAIRHRQKLVSPDQMGDFLARLGIDKTLFVKIYSSDEVQARVVDAKNKVLAYGVTGVPALVVDHKYRFDQSAGGPEGMLKLAELLISKERVARQMP